MRSAFHYPWLRRTITHLLAVIGQDTRIEVATILLLLCYPGSHFIRAPCLLFFGEIPATSAKDENKLLHRIRRFSVSHRRVARALSESRSRLRPQPSGNASTIRLPLASNSPGQWRTRRSSPLSPQMVHR